MTFCPAPYCWLMFVRTFFFLTSSSSFLRCSSSSLLSFSSCNASTGDTMYRRNCSFHADILIWCRVGWLSWSTQWPYRKSGLPLLLSLCSDPLLLCSLSTAVLLKVRKNTFIHTVVVISSKQNQNPLWWTRSQFCWQGRWAPPPLSSSGWSEPRSETAVQPDPSPDASCGCPVSKTHIIGVLPIKVCFCMCVSRKFEGGIWEDQLTSKSTLSPSGILGAETFVMNL